MARKRIGLSLWMCLVAAALPAVAQQSPPPGLFPNSDFRSIDVPRAIYDAAPRTDHQTVPATHAPVQPQTSSPREAVPLSPPGARASAKLPLRSSSGEGAVKPSSGLGSGMVTMFSALAIVLGLFLTAVLLIRRGSQKPARMLPKEAVELLGRMPFPGRQQGHLLRVGNKIILASFSTGGADVLAEITDPMEVDRLAGICRQDDPYSSTGAFRSLLDQFFREKPRTGRDTAVAASAAQEDDDA